MEIENLKSDDNGIGKKSKNSVKTTSKGSALDKGHLKKEKKAGDKKGAETDEDDANKSKRRGHFKGDKKRSGSNEDGVVRNIDAGSDRNNSPSNAKYLRKRKASYRARSQTAGGNAMRGGEDGMNRRKQ